MSTPNAVRVASCRLRTPWAVFTMHGYAENGGGEHVAMTLGAVASGQPVLTRLHSECLTGEALFSQQCDCGAQLEAALRAIALAERGVLLYLRQEGRGIGLLNKIKAYRLQEEGADTVDANRMLGFDADLRDYGIAAAMLEDLGILSVHLLTNNPRKIEALGQAGITVVERVPLVVGWNAHNAGYGASKATRLGHLLPLVGSQSRPGRPGIELSPSASGKGRSFFGRGDVE